VGNRTYIYSGPVRELLINSEKARISYIFKKQKEFCVCRFNNSCPLPLFNDTVFLKIIILNVKIKLMEVEEK
jgi:hypothetical protein